MKYNTNAAISVGMKTQAQAMTVMLVAALMYHFLSAA
jgi:hypothetical protein